MYTLKEKIIIAVDGFSSCGKSSYAKLIAKELGYLYLDSGAMYRAVSLFVLRNDLVIKNKIDNKRLIDLLGAISITFKKENSDIITYLNNENVEKEIRGSQVSGIVSQVSKIPEVRSHLVKLQQKMGADKGIVMDGRDIGTVVFPDAEIKIFMKADVMVRAERRFKELTEKGIEADLSEIKANIEERDHLDLHRTISPLKQAADAYVLDNSNMTFEEQMDWFRAILVQKNYL